MFTAIHGQIAEENNAYWLKVDDCRQAKASLRSDSIYKSQKYLKIALLLRRENIDNVAVSFG